MFKKLLATLAFQEKQFTDGIELKTPIVLKSTAISRLRFKFIFHVSGLFVVKNITISY